MHWDPWRGTKLALFNCTLFQEKLDELKNESFKREIFGKVLGCVYAIEHTKKRLLHAHFLIILERDWRLYTLESFNEIVSAEIPNQEKNLNLHRFVIKHIMHGPCGMLKLVNDTLSKMGATKTTI